MVVAPQAEGEVKAGGEQAGVSQLLNLRADLAVALEHEYGV
jgi:hypothetical protein